MEPSLRCPKGHLFFMRTRDQQVVALDVANHKNE
jgi:hypothetical protein